MSIPELPHGCNSWIIVERSTGKAILETWNRSIAEKINQDRFEVKTALQHLQDLNKNDT